MLNKIFWLPAKLIFSLKLYSIPFIAIVNMLVLLICFAIKLSFLFNPMIIFLVTIVKYSVLFVFNSYIMAYVLKKIVYEKLSF